MSLLERGREIEPDTLLRLIIGPRHRGVSLTQRNIEDGCPCQIDISGIECDRVRVLENIETRVEVSSARLNKTRS